MNCLCPAHWLGYWLSSRRAARVLSSPCKASKTRCTTGCSDVQQPHPARLLAASACLDIRHKPEHREIQVGGGNSEMQEITKNLQLIVNSVAAGSQGASRYHFNKDHKSLEKHRKVIEANPGEKAVKAKGRSGKGGNELYLINSRANWHSLDGNANCPTDIHPLVISPSSLISSKWSIELFLKSQVTQEHPGFHPSFSSMSHPHLQEQLNYLLHGNTM